jgi:hypothetical protein
MQEIIERLGAELGAAPPPAAFDVRTTIGAGRRAVRRRRLAAGGAALALMLIVGGVGVAVTSQFGGSQAEQPSVQVAAGVSAEGLEPTSGLNDGFPAGYDPQDDDVRIRDGWEVYQRVDGPVDGIVDGSARVTSSVGLALRSGSDIVWVLLYRHAPVSGDPSSATGRGLAETPEEAGYDDFTSWLAHQKDRMAGAAR